MFVFPIYYPEYCDQLATYSWQHALLTIRLNRTFNSWYCAFPSRSTKLCIRSCFLVVTGLCFRIMTVQHWRRPLLTEQAAALRQRLAQEPERYRVGTGAGVGAGAGVSAVAAYRAWLA